MASWSTARLAAFEARSLPTDIAGADALWRAAEQSGSRMVAAQATVRRRALA